jgi:hypothetical protein
MLGVGIKFLLVLCLWHIAAEGTLEYAEVKSPYNQHLKTCTNSTVLRKKTEMKGILCPMVKDEKGFLSEWVAFYEVQGFEKFIFYDNNSTEDFNELNHGLWTGGWKSSESGGLMTSMQPPTPRSVTTIS